MELSNHMLHMHASSTATRPLTLHGVDRLPLILINKDQVALYTNSPTLPSGWLGGAVPFKELHYANALLHPHNEFTEDYYHNTVLFFTAVNTSIKR